MKKTISAFLVCFAIFANAQAQELQVSKEKIIKPIKTYSPKTGDLGLTVDLLSPVMTYVGNMFNGNTNNTFPTSFSGPNYNGNVSISGKYFVYDDFALRASVSLNNASLTTSALVRNDAALAADPLSVAQVNDTRNILSKNMYLSLGAEIRRGYARLQGFYGAQILCGYESLKTSYTYGNPITATNNIPSQAFATTPSDNIGGNSRLLETNTTGGRSLLIGLGGFVGVEYFILPRVAIGGEVALTGMLVFGGEEREKSERYSTSDNQVEKNTRKYSEGTDLAKLSTHNFGNSFYVAFYF